MITSTICTSTILVQHSPGTTAGEGKRLAPLTPSQQKAPLRLTAPRRRLPLKMQRVTWKCGDIQDLKNKQVLHLKWKRRERAEIPGDAAAIRTDRCSKNVCLPASRRGQSGAGEEPWRDHSRAKEKARRSQSRLLDKVFHFRREPTRGR